MDRGLYEKPLFDQFLKIKDRIRRGILVEPDRKAPSLALFAFLPLNIEHRDIFGRKDRAGYNQRYSKGDKSFYHGMNGRLRSSAVPIKSELFGCCRWYLEPG